MLSEAKTSDLSYVIDPLAFLCYNHFHGVINVTRQKPSLLVIEDEDSMQRTYRSILREAYNPVLAGDFKAALDNLKDGLFPLTILDMRLPDINGLEALGKIKEIDNNIEVIVVTAVNDIKSAVQAIKLGAYDYITKPFEVDALLEVLKKALERRSLVRENNLLRQTLEEREPRFIGQTEPMKKVFAIIKKVAATDGTILVTGESGTGKELVAHAIHNQSPRKNKPLVIINCAAIPENLIESELFGHEKGAFTGALERKEGKFELADGGTIFLDEIGCMKASLQSKLLRVLQDNIIERVGGKSPIQVNVRTIAATNLNLKEAIKKNEFREDLYYRLNIINLCLPPLRERKEDIPLFLNYFLDKFNKELNKDVAGFNQEALSVLIGYDWPGNVRELQNLTERVVTLSENGACISVEDLPLENFSPNIVRKSLKEAVAEFEKRYIKNALMEADNNQTKASDILGIHRTTLIAKMAQFGLK